MSARVFNLLDPIHFLAVFHRFGYVISTYQQKGRRFIVLHPTCTLFCIQVLSFIQHFSLPLLVDGVGPQLVFALLISASFRTWGIQLAGGSP